MDTTPLRRRRRLPGFLAVTLATAVIGAAGVWWAAQRAVADIRRIPGVAEVLSPASPAVDNYLLVGSDSRAAGDPNTGETGGVSGNRSDTIIVLRIDRRDGSAALLSIPRDLYVRTEGHTGRINGAYNDGAAALVVAVQQALRLPVHHYVEIDFSGFEGLVNSLGGVEICFGFPTRDINTGLDVPVAGCRVLDGRGALAYARSRHYEELRDGTWVTDPTSDLGRSARQRDFVNRTLQAALSEVTANPFRAGSVVAAVTSAISIDAALDPIDAAARLRTAVGGGLTPFALPVVDRTIDGAAVLEVGDGAESVLAFFRGEGPAPGD